MKRTSKNYCSKKESLYYSEQYKEFLLETNNIEEYKKFTKKYDKDEYNNFLITHSGVKHLDELLLVSSLISTTDQKKYRIKIVDCGEYKQIYYYNELKLKKDKNYIKERRYDAIDTTYLFKEENIKRKNEKKLIEYKNVNRSKFKMQRLIKANEKEFKTFITLTFDDSINDIEQANKKFRYFRDSLQRSYKELKYVCVPEFQKNGRVHYHLLTNIDYENEWLINENIYYRNLIEKLRKNKYKIVKQKIKEFKYKKIHLNDLNVVLRKFNNKWNNTKKNFNYKSKEYKIFKTIKYWNNGFSNVIPIENIDVVGYISKYMTKDIDNRLFGRQKYLFSRNLVMPKEYYFDLEDKQEYFIFMDIINNSKVVYKNSYLDVYEKEISFVEYKLKEKKEEFSFKNAKDLIEVDFEEILKYLG